MTKHTPGPWTQTGQDIVSETLRETLSSGRKIRLRIANAKDAGGKLDLETVKANAALIAAAPDLLAEVEGRVARVQTALAAANRTGNTAIIDFMHQWFGDQTVSAALAKAEGADK